MPSRPNSIVILSVLLVLILAVAGTVTWLVATQVQKPAEVAQAAPSVSTVTDKAPATGTATPTAPVARVAGPVHFTPKFRNRDLQILESPYFRIGYDNQRKSPAWVVYDLDGPIMNTGASPARPRFQTDFNTSAHVSDSDYANGGYDRGHMVPAYAMWSRHGAKAFEATFVMSNVVPQKHAMNAGIWEDLEDNIAGQCRGGGVVDQGYAGRLRGITVINGPVFTEPVEKLKNGTWIPSACFSIVLDYQEEAGTYRAMAFEIPNVDGTKGPLTRWLTTIRKVEDRTGLDFFDGNEEVRKDIDNRSGDQMWKDK
jgi:endonuclease G